jgi:hypothetical protein
MAVKRFQTRIALKRDTEANWYASSFSLLDGEIGISRGIDNYIWRPDGETSTPITNFKIGDGTSVWKQLWFAIPEIKMQTLGSNGEALTTWNMAPSSLNSKIREYSLTGINSNLVQLFTGNSGDQDHPTYTIQAPSWAGSGENGAPAGTFNLLSASIIDIDHALAELTDTVAGIDTGVVSIGGQSGTISIDQNYLGMTVSGTTKTLTANVVALDNATSNNDGLATALDVKTYVDNQILNTLDSEVTFKGVTSTKPSASSVNNGDMWKTSAVITFTSAEDQEGNGFTTKSGDTIIAKVTGSGASRNTTWYLIPSADDVEDTWRPVYVQSTRYLDSSISSGSLVFGSSAGNPVRIQSITPTQEDPNLTVWYQHALLDDPTENSPWTSRGAVKIKTDSWGHVRTDGAITASDISITDSGNHFTSTTVEDALSELHSASAGTLNTNNTTSQTPSSSESLSGTVSLHKVSKTGRISDLVQDAPSNGNTSDMVIFECGSATVNTLS